MHHNGDVANKAIRKSVSLPANLATQVRNMAKSRRVSANRMLVELIENGIEAEKNKQKEFFELAERFRVGRQQVVQSSHLMMIERPEVVSEAILEMVASSRRRAPATR